jgi:peptidyl-tRNA hydrolase
LSCGGLNEEEKEPQSYKMVVLVRSDLDMGIGKVASQVAHAALGASGRCSATVRNAWDDGGEAIIVLAVRSFDEMMQLEASARSAGVGTYIVQDAGRTQVAEGTATVCAIGPEAVGKVDQITRHLKLL